MKRGQALQECNLPGDGQLETHPLDERGRGSEVPGYQPANLREVEMKI